MVLQYRLKTGRKWADYPGKARVKGAVSKYDFRLLSHDRKKVLVSKGSYKAVLKRMRQIEFFKHR